MQMGKSDLIDHEILKILKTDGRATIRGIAKTIDTSPATVSRKIKHMEDQKIIKGYVAIIEEAKIGKGSQSVLLVRLSGGYEKTKTLDNIMNMKDICNVFLTMGHYDLICTACTYSEEHLHKIIEEIKSLKHVLWIDSCMVINKRKVMNVILEDNTGLSQAIHT